MIVRDQDQQRMCLGGVGGRGIQLVGRGRTWLEFRSGIESFLWPFVLQLDSKEMDLVPLEPCWTLLDLLKNDR